MRVFWFLCCFADIKITSKTASYNYDELNRLTTKKNIFAAGTVNERVLSSFNYSVNLDGKRGAMNETVLDPDAVNGTQTSISGAIRTLSYNYDNANRLAQEKREERQRLRAGGETSSTRTTDYSYDAVSKDESVASLLETGRRMQKLWLKVREKSIGLHPMTQILEKAPTRQTLNQSVGISDPIQFLLRLVTSEIIPRRFRCAAL